jgi:hypothetical protein
MDKTQSVGTRKLKLYESTGGATYRVVLKFVELLTSFRLRGLISA